MSENARKRQGCAHWFSAALRGGLAGFLLLWTGAVRPGGAPGSARPVPTPTPTSVTPVRGQPVCVTPVTDLGPYPDQPVALTGVAAFGPRDAWAAGYVVHGIAGTIYGARFPLIEHWNGVRWVTLKLPSAPGKGLMSLAAVSAHDMWAVGNNVAWHSPLFPLSMYQQLNQEDIDAFAVASPRDIWALGRYTLPGVGYAPGYRYGPILAHWDGIAWRRVPSPFPALPQDKALVGATNATAAHAPDNVWIARANQVAHWDGHSWQRHDLAIPGAAILALTARALDDVWAVGTHGYCDGTYWESCGKSLIAHWDGVCWQEVSSPLRPSQRRH